MKRLNSYGELYEYLLGLARELKSLRLEELSEAVSSVSHQAWGMSTEFLGESRIALQRVLDEENGALSRQQRSEVSDVLAEIHRALTGGEAGV